VRLAPLLPALLLLAACSGSPDAPSAERTTDASCDAVIPASVITDLGWTPRGAATSTVRGCHREGEQGYVEVRSRPSASYAALCRTLDNTGGTAPGVPVDWLGRRTACAVEPTSGVGSTKVVVKAGKGVTEVTVTAVTATDPALVRAAVKAVL
jgi:hypothetical protein